MVKAGKLHRWQWVGQNDDSAHSQGHYRLYFGLAKRKRIQQLVVQWPDGQRTRLGPLKANRLLEVEHP
jgi:hypothetical protein